MAKKTYDLVILDWYLPDMLGDEVAEKIKEEYSSTDIIFITGYSSKKDEVEGQLDEEEVLIKPIIPESLLEAATKRLAREQR
jgi:DNA-binding response OmpR family regulator